MGRDLYREFASVRDRFAEAEDLLGLSLTGICFEGPMEVLSQTMGEETVLLLSTDGEVLRYLESSR